MSYVDAFVSMKLTDITKRGKYKVLSPYAKELDPIEFQLSVQEILGEMIPSYKKTEFFEAAGDYVLNLKTKKPLDLVTVDPKIKAVSDAYKQGLMDLVAVREISASSETKGQKLLFCKETRRVVDVDFDLYMETLGNRKDIINNLAIARITFNPYKKESLFIDKDGDKDCVFLNKYVPPKWMDRSPSNSSIESNLIYRATKHTFNDEFYFEHALCALYHMITSRYKAYVVIFGSKGCGKSKFTEVAAQLIGIENSNVDVKDKDLIGDFNEAYYNSRLLVFNEFVFDSSGSAKTSALKANIGDSVYLNLKNRSRFMSTVYCSAFILSNNEDNFRADADDRVFSCYKPNVQDLNSTLYEEELDELTRIVKIPSLKEPDQQVIDFGHWLLKRYEKGTPYTNTDIAKGDYFYEMITKSYRGMIGWFLEDVLNNIDNYYDPIAYTTIVKNYKKNKIEQGDEKANGISSERMISFLETYKYYGKMPIGSLEMRETNTGNERFYFVIDQEFIKELKLRREQRAEKRRVIKLPKLGRKSEEIDL